MTVRSDSSTIHLVLASASPRRRELLGMIGLRFHVVPSTVEEAAADGETPTEHVRRLALAKARQVSQKFPDLWVLGADTIVVKDRQFLGKPRNALEAKAMLTKLARATHRVFTAYALVMASRPELERVRDFCSSVHLRDLSSDEIDAYIDTGEPMDKAGAYAIQGIGSAIVDRISGSYTNVVGLPLCEVAQDLRELGIFDFLLSNRFHDRR